MDGRAASQFRGRAVRLLVGQPSRLSRGTSGTLSYELHLASREFTSSVQRCLRRLLEPGKRGQVRLNPTQHLQHGSGQVHSAESRAVRSPGECGGRLPATAASTGLPAFVPPGRRVVGRRLGDRRQLQPVESRSLVKPQDPSQAAIDDRCHAIDRERGLRDVRRQNDLSPRARPQNGVLLLRRQVAIERK